MFGTSSNGHQGLIPTPHIFSVDKFCGCTLSECFFLRHRLFQSVSFAFYCQILSQICDPWFYKFKGDLFIVSKWTRVCSNVVLNTSGSVCDSCSFSAHLEKKRKWVDETSLLFLCACMLTFVPGQYFPCPNFSTSWAGLLVVMAYTQTPQILTIQLCF